MFANSVCTDIKHIPYKDTFEKNVSKNILQSDVKEMF